MKAGLLILAGLAIASQAGAQDAAQGIAAGLVVDAELRPVIEDVVETPAPEPTPAPAAALPGPTSMSEDGMSVRVYAGALASFGSDVGGTATPTARIEVESFLADGGLVPKLRVLAALSALPGESIEIANPETYKSIEFSLTVAQPLSSRLRFSGYVTAGFASRLAGEPEALDKAPRWAGAGLEFASRTRGRLDVGFGLDQRLDGAQYVPCVHVSGIVGLWANEDGAQVAFAGDAILGLDLTSRWPTLPVARRDTIRAGVLVGWGTGN